MSAASQNDYTGTRQGTAQQRHGIPPKAALVRNSDTYRNSQGHLALSVRRKKKCRFLRQAALGHKDTAMQMGEA